MNQANVFDNWVDARTYGLFPDTGVDEGALLNTVLASAAGKNIYFAPGVYLKSTTTFQPSGCQVYAYGCTFKTINGTPAANDLGWFGTDTTWLIPSNNIAFRGGVIDGNAANRTGSGQAALFYPYQCQNVVIEDAQFINGMADGLEICGEYFSTSELSGVAGTCTSTTITLTGGSATVNFYVNHWVVITDGKGEGQKRQITAYNSTTKVATVAAWDITPDANSTFSCAVNNDRTSIAKNWRIRNVICNNNYRNNCSFVGSRNIRVDDSQFNGAVGTLPKAGIDFEPNHASGINTDLLLVNCIADGNGMNGYMDAANLTYRAVLINCHASRNGQYGLLSIDKQRIGTMNFSGASNATSLFSGSSVELFGTGNSTQEVLLWDDSCAYSTTSTGNWVDIETFTVTPTVAGTYILLAADLLGTVSTSMFVSLRWVDVDNAVNGKNHNNQYFSGYSVDIKDRFVIGTGTRTFKLQGNPGNAGTLAVSNIHASAKII